MDICMNDCGTWDHFGSAVSTSMFTYLEYVSRMYGNPIFIVLKSFQENLEELIAHQRSKYNTAVVF